MTDLQKQAVIAFAESNMRLSEAARALHYHHNSIDHHLRAVKNKTGLDPRNFFDLQKLYAMAKGEDE